MPIRGELHHVQNFANFRCEWLKRDCINKLLMIKNSLEVFVYYLNECVECLCFTWEHKSIDNQTIFTDLFLCYLWLYTNYITISVLYFNYVGRLDIKIRCTCNWLSWVRNKSFQNSWIFPHLCEGLEESMRYNNNISYFYGTK